MRDETAHEWGIQSVGEDSIYGPPANRIEDSRPSAFVNNLRTSSRMTSIYEDHFPYVGSEKREGFSARR